MVVLIDTNVIMDDLVTREAFFKKYEYISPLPWKNHGLTSLHTQRQFQAMSLQKFLV